MKWQQLCTRDHICDATQHEEENRAPNELLVRELACM